MREAWGPVLPAKSAPTEGAATTGQALGDDIRATIDGIRVTLEFEAVSFNEVVDFLREISGVTMAIDNTNIEDPPEPMAVTLHDAPLAQALEVISSKSGREWRTEDGMVLFAQKGRLRSRSVRENPETARIDLVATNATLGQLVDQVRSLGIRIDIIGEPSTRTTQVDLRGVLVRSAIDWLCAEFGTTSRITGDRVIVRCPE